MPYKKMKTDEDKYVSERQGKDIYKSKSTKGKKRNQMLEYVRVKRRSLLGWSGKRFSMTNHKW